VLGGIVTAGLLAHLAETGSLPASRACPDGVRADNARADTVGVDQPRGPAAAVAESARKGYLDGKAPGRVSRGCARMT